MQLNRNQILYGSKADLPQQITLRSGALSLLFEEGTIRHIKLGKTVIMHQIYAAIRDHNWDTVPGKLSNLLIDAHEDSFEISFSSHHKKDKVDFRWIGTITGDSSGTIRFHFDGQANSAFDRNRIGFCVLHPASCAGQACTVEDVDGSTTKGKFPLYISPHQPFFNIRAITHQVNGVDVRVLMEGDTFEMEDQRNWTDASYKTYCTPLGLPFPVTVSKGDRIQQSITLSLGGYDAHNAHEDDSTIKVSIEDEVSGKLPQIGLGIPEASADLNELQVKRLSALNLNHLRVDIYLKDDLWQSVLASASEQAILLNCQLEIAVHLTEDAENQLMALNEFAGNHDLPIARWIIFHVHEKSTSAQWVQLARQYLSSAPIGTGTNAFFTELNRERPPIDTIDFAAYSTNPQVHAFDNLSLVENLAIQAETVKTARQFCEDKPIVVSPITLKMRFNPNATGELPPIPEGELPPQVDKRQMSLFGACWTLGSLKYYVESQDVESVTYFETVGWRGVLARSGAPQLPDKFPLIADSVFPMYHVFRDIGEVTDAIFVASHTTHPLLVDVLTLKSNNKLTVLIANMSPNPQTVQLHIPQAQYECRRLNQTNAIEAMTKPESYRLFSSQINLGSSSLIFELTPYEYVRLKQE